MTRLLLVLGVLALCACDSLTIAGSNKVSDNVAVSLGTTITENGVKPRGSLTVGLF